MGNRKPMLYYFPKKDEHSDLLIFDAGYPEGFIHIHAKNEPRKSAELEKILKEYNEKSRGMARELRATAFPRTWK